MRGDIRDYGRSFCIIGERTGCGCKKPNNMPVTYSRSQDMEKALSLLYTKLFTISIQESRNDHSPEGNDQAYAGSGGKPLMV